MAEAIKKISVQKGYHLGEYALCCYGTAGALHACLLADLQAQIAAYSQPVVLTYTQHVQNHAEACVKAQLQPLDEGRLEYESDQHHKITIAVTMNNFTVDRSGNSGAAFSGDASGIFDTPRQRR